MLDLARAHLKPGTALVAAGLLAVVGGLAAWAQGDAVVRADNAEIGHGFTGTVVVTVDGVAALYGADVQLSFDPAALEGVDTNPDKPGVQLVLGSFLSTDLVIRDEIDNTAGTVHFAATQLNPAPPQDGSGTLFSVVFRAKRTSGTTPIRVTSATLATRDGLEIPSTTRDGVVSLLPAAQAPATPTTAPVVQPTLVLGGQESETRPAERAPSGSEQDAGSAAAAATRSDTSWAPPAAPGTDVSAPAAPISAAAPGAAADEAREQATAAPAAVGDTTTPEEAGAAAPVPESAVDPDDTAAGRSDDGARSRWPLLLAAGLVVAGLAFLIVKRS